MSKEREFRQISSVTVDFPSEVCCDVSECLCICPFLGAFAKVRRATISFVMSVRPHGRTRLPLDGFLWNTFEFFRKSAKKIQASLISDKNNWHFTLRRFHIYNNTSLNCFWNVSDRICRGNQHTHWTFNTFFFLKNRAVYGIISKNVLERDRTLMTIQYSSCTSSARWTRLHARTPTHSGTHARTQT
jgi:hypothetical protein